MKISVFSGKLIPAAVGPSTDLFIFQASWDFFGPADISNSRSNGPAAYKVNFDPSTLLLLFCFAV